MTHPEGIGQESTRELESIPSLGELMTELEAAGIEPLSEDVIRDALDRPPHEAVLSRAGVDGLRASPDSGRPGVYKVWTTNIFENPDHPIAQKFRFKRFTL